MSKKALKRVAAAVLPVAAAMSIVTAAPASANHVANCEGAEAWTPWDNGGSSVTGAGRYYRYCQGHSTLVEVYFWLNGDPIRIASSGWYSNDYRGSGPIYASATKARGCYAYYTKVSINQVGIWRSPGKTLCR